MSPTAATTITTQKATSTSSSGKTPLETSGEDAKLHSKRVEKMRKLHSKRVCFRTPGNRLVARHSKKKSNGKKCRDTGVILHGVKIHSKRVEKMCKLHSKRVEKMCKLLSRRVEKMCKFRSTRFECGFCVDPSPSSLRVQVAAQVQEDRGPPLWRRAVRQGRQGPYPQGFSHW